MKESFDLLIHGGTIADGTVLKRCDIGIRDGKIASLESLDKAPAKERLDASGWHVLPGLIDTQTHFREPGACHKEDIACGSAGALLGGVTSIFEMPNTNPPTIDAAALQDKCQRAQQQSWCDYAFFIGAVQDNISQLHHLENLPGCCGIKIFMGSSTGSLLLEGDGVLHAAIGNGKRRVSVHCEDEERLRLRRSIARNVHDHPLWRDPECATRAVTKLLEAAHHHHRPVHVLHVNSREETALLQRSRDVASFEITPQHLTLEAPQCYDQRGTLAQVNPPIRDASHRQALWHALDPNGDCVIGSDHAPHTLEEKKRPYPDSPSGMPGVQTILPLMLNHCAQGRLSLNDLVRLTSVNPARLFAIKGKGQLSLGADADLAIVDLTMQKKIDNHAIASRCGWSAFDGTTVTGWPRATVLRGRIVMRDGVLIDRPQGHVLTFDDPPAP